MESTKNEIPTKTARRHFWPKCYKCALSWRSVARVHHPQKKHSTGSSGVVIFRAPSPTKWIQHLLLRRRRKFFFSSFATTTTNNTQHTTNNHTNNNNMNNKSQQHPQHTTTQQQQPPQQQPQHRRQTETPTTTLMRSNCFGHSGLSHTHDLGHHPGEHWCCPWLLLWSRWTAEMENKTHSKLNKKKPAQAHLRTYMWQHLMQRVHLRLREYDFSHMRCLYICYPCFLFFRASHGKIRNRDNIYISTSCTIYGKYEQWNTNKNRKATFLAKML